MDTQKYNDSMIKKYIDSLTAIELKAYEIAKTHLQSSFSVEKSIGFIEWRRKHD
jgi:hypothetical protein